MANVFMLEVIDGPHVPLSAGVDDSDGGSDFDGTELAFGPFLAILGKFLPPFFPVSRGPVVPRIGSGEERLYLVTRHTYNVAHLGYLSS